MKRLDGIGRLAPLAVAGLLAISACTTRSVAPAEGPADARRFQSIAARESAAARALERLAKERANAAIFRGYRLGPGDLVEIAVFDLKELNRKVRVSKSGEILLPLIGSVRAAGKTEAELARDIADRLSQEYLQSPQIDVFVAEYRSELVAVTGSVSRPGLYPLTRGRNTILDLVTEAGGLTKDAGAFIEFMPARSGAAKIAMKRAREDAKRPLEESPPGGITIDLTELMRGANRTLISLPVIPGDVIAVPTSGMFSVEGWVQRPGSYLLTRGMTVLSAISAGGGELFPAELSRVELFREEATGEPGESMQLVDLEAVRAGEGQDVVLRAGDIVRVPSNVVKLVPYSVYWTLTNFILFGLGGGTSFPVS